MFQIMKPGHVYRVIKQWDTPEGVMTCEHVINFQDGPIKEVGVNGIQNIDLLDILIDRIEYLQTTSNGHYACEENENMLAMLKVTRREDTLRTKNRIKRGVEGINKV